MLKKIISPIFFIGTFLLMVACEPDVKELDTSLLIGNWELTKAFSKDRGDKKMEATQRLNGAFFSFAEAGKMTSNITGSPIQGNYAINGQELSQTSDTSSPINYKIELLTPDSLTLTTKLSGIDFKLHLLKK